MSAKFAQIAPWFVREGIFGMATRVPIAQQYAPAAVIVKTAVLPAATAPPCARPADVINGLYAGNAGFTVTVARICAMFALKFAWNALAGIIGAEPAT